MPYLYKQTYLEVISHPVPRITLEEEKFSIEDIKKGYRYEWTDLDQQYKPKSLWLAWQRDVQIASRTPDMVPQHVVDYYQDTKHLGRPPQPGDVVLRTGKDLMVAPQYNHTEASKPSGKPLFAISYTGMTTFQQCPAKWAAEKWFKTVPYEEGEAQAWGNRVHLAMENYLQGTHTPADKQLLVDNGWEKYPQLILQQVEKAGADLFVEKEICVTQLLQPCGWKDWNTVWFRNKADVLIKKLSKLKYFDWKTGKRKEDEFQMEVTWAIAAQHFPDVEEFDGKLIFLSDPNPVFSLPKPLTRDDLTGIWDRIHAIHDRMLKAAQSGIFQEKSSGLCKKYCGNTACIHCGGSR